MSYLLVFLLMFCFDILYTQYLIYVEKRKALQAAITSSIMYLFSSYITLKWVEDTKFVIPAVIGGFLGTYWIIRRQNENS